MLQKCQKSSAWIAVLETDTETTEVDGIVDAHNLPIYTYV
jgi:hypothetical protein